MLLLASTCVSALSSLSGIYVAGNSNSNLLLHVHYAHVLGEAGDLATGNASMVDVRKCIYRRSVDLPMPLRPIRPYLRPYTKLNVVSTISCLPLLTMMSSRAARHSTFLRWA